MTRVNFGSRYGNLQIPYEISNVVNTYISKGEFRKANCLLESYKKYIKGKSIHPTENDLSESSSKRKMVSDIANKLNARKDIPKIIYFIDKHNIDIDKLYKYVNDVSLSDRLNVLAAILGKDDNPLQTDFIKRFERAKEIKESYKMDTTDVELLDLAIQRIMSRVGKKMDDMKSNGNSHSDTYKSLETTYNSLKKRISDNG